ncbi:MAG: heme-degrading domain-containing protein [Actinobacteria bacterium]|jgi:uncharacterized protein (UPF0303 family)|nr:heme-degrading domain-containing protein [Actinomycetota bacterium]
MSATTGGYSSDQLADQAAACEFDRFALGDAVALGLLATQRAREAGKPIVIEVRHLGRVAYRASLPGSLPDSDDWIARKARVVERFRASTMAVRVSYEEKGTSFVAATGLPESEYAAHGGGFPIVVKGVGVVGGFYASGLPQVEDHEFLVACLTEYASRQD